MTNFFKKNSLKIIAILTGLVVLLLVALISLRAAGLLLALGFLVFSLYLYVEQADQDKKRILQKQLDELYNQTADLVYGFCYEYECFGFNATNEMVVRMPKDRFRRKKNVQLLHYKCPLKPNCDMDVERVRNKVNELMEDDYLYRHLYILQMKRLKDEIHMLLVIRQTQQEELLIRECERGTLSKGQTTAADKTDQEF